MKTVTPDINFPQLEKQIIDFWKENKIFEKSLKQRQNSPRFMFYDGPPFSSGLPHYGHLLVGTIKDIIPRYQTMKGKYVERRFGWDTHGLPIEMIIEQRLGLKGRKDILEYGVDKYNETCRAAVLSCVDEWEKVTTRLGRWIDFVNDYKTMDPDFMESVWWVFKELWKQGRIYEGTRSMPYSWRLATPLSNFEASSNYKDVQDPAITVRFKVREEAGLSILAWTTTPWTLPSNMALCVGPTLDYVKIRTTSDELLILAEARLPAYFKDPKEYQVIERYNGNQLTKFTYEPLFNYFSHLRDHGAFRVITDSYVAVEDGSGVVHTAPGHGEDDHRIGTEQGIPVVDPTDAEGSFLPEVSDFAGQNVKEADKNIIHYLKDKGLLFKHETITHSYPFCERSDTPLIFKAISAWYVKVEDLRERMQELNREIHWIPEHIKEGRFGNWLANARDWNISRNRFWGNPLPLWRCQGCGEIECLGSKSELEEKCGKTVTDLHKHFVDKLEWRCAKCSSTMTRVSEVLDCWFESGSMPYAALHYPFENKDTFKDIFPADFINESIDQTRGWFYTLTVLSTALFDSAPFKNCICTGMILAEDGKKMSKRLKNYPDPIHVMESLGADALRLYLINSPVVRANNLRFSEAGVREIVRTVMLPFWNVYSFFTTYASIDKFVPAISLTSSTNILDRWIVSRFQTLLSNIHREMQEYRLYNVVPVLLEFIEELTNWYVRRSRRRFWSDDTNDKAAGYNTLYFILTGFSRCLAPFLPFITEEIFTNLATLSSDSKESVHLENYPEVDKKLQDSELEHAMALIINTVKLGRTLRSRLNLKIRQPLASITVVTRNESDAEVLKTYGSHIEEELNVKKVLFSSKESELVEIEIKPDFRACGPIFGKEMKTLVAELKKLSSQEIDNLSNGEKITVLGQQIDSSLVQVIRRSTGDQEIETDKGVTVFFDVNLSDQLISEGQSREFINRIQRMRKDANFHVSDRIKIKFFANEALLHAIQKNKDYIQEETLALDLVHLKDAPTEGELIQEHEIEQIALVIAISRS